MDENGFVRPVAVGAARSAELTDPCLMIITKTYCFHREFFLVGQIRTLSYLSPDCDAAYLDLRRIRLLCTFAYLVGIMNFGDKTQESEFKKKATFPS